MKKIGMIGGASWHSTIDYYRIINEEIGRRIGGYHSADLVMACPDFDLIAECAKSGDLSPVTDVLWAEAKRLEVAGADFFMICSNTLHKIAEEVAADVNIPILHIVDAVAGEINKNGLKKVLLLGTKCTMEDGFFQDRAGKHGIEIVVPSEKDRTLVDKVVFEELVFNKIVDSSRNEFVRIISAQANQGAQGVILGCTEIQMLIKQENVAIPIFDSTTIHAMAAVDMALSLDS